MYQNDEELNSSKNLEIPHWRYEKFDLEKYGNDECLANFRFYKNDLYDLADALNLPRNGFVCSNGTY